jgi:hypothetical protein
MSETARADSGTVNALALLNRCVTHGRQAAAFMGMTGQANWNGTSCRRALAITSMKSTSSHPTLKRR